MWFYLHETCCWKMPCLGHDCPHHKAEGKVTCKCRFLHMFPENPRNGNGQLLDLDFNMEILHSVRLAKYTRGNLNYLNLKNSSVTASINSQNPFQIHWFVAIKSKNRCLPQRCQLFLHHVPNLVAKDSSRNLARQCDEILSSKPSDDW